MTYANSCPVCGTPVAVSPSPPASERELDKLERAAALEALDDLERAFIVAVGDKSPFAKRALSRVSTIRSLLKPEETL